ncbi:MAG: hypothetical protein HRU20_09010 [Pseudomonadales bacterium]|nr:hypothetical protein [Pseudomonadales bacterium]
MLCLVVFRQLGLQDDEHKTGLTPAWGFNISTNIHVAENDKISASIVAGKGIARYINDTSFGNYDALINADGELEALPVAGAFVFYDHAWNDKAHSNLGYGYLTMDNDKQQSEDAFAQSQYFVLNYLYQLAKPVQVGA